MSKKTVEASMARQGRPRRRRRGLTRPGAAAAPAADLLRRDSAAAESFFATLQKELLCRRTYTTRAEARHDITAWIDGWYKPRRLHPADNMTSPTDHENAQAA